MIDIRTPDEILLQLARNIRELRLSKNLTQAQLSERSNVSLAVLKKFERTGKISLESFIKLTFVLGAAGKIPGVLKFEIQPYSSLDDLLANEEKLERKRAYSPRKKKNG
jgi:transcriptional regulator with XRE-family HTH domain